jgi:putative oxidoreductase
VAIASVHAGHGYTISEGGWKLPLIYLVMFLPLILSGPGKLSVDHWLRERHLKAERRLWS